MENYYRDMWRKIIHMLAPLSGLVNTIVNYYWGDEQQAAFEELNKKISQETLSAFPDFNNEFHVY
jgi:hypothetical protein